MKNDIKLILAPMAGFTDQPFRRICREHGADEVVTELLSANALVRDSEKTMRMADIHPEERPASVQIFGSDPGVMAEAAQRLEFLKPLFIDINMGCPVKKVVKNGAGSALLETPELAGEIVRRVAEAVKTPVSVKIRMGKSRNSLTGFDVAKRAVEAGARRVTVHARTVADMFSGDPDLAFMSVIKKELSVEVIGNGGIHGFADAKRWMEETGVDGLMIGRGAIGYPSIFEDIRNGKEHQITTDMKTIFRHLDLMEAFYGPVKSVGPMRAHLMYYSKGFGAARKFRQAVNNAETSNAIKDIVKGLMTNEYEKVA